MIHFATDGADGDFTRRRGARTGPPGVRVSSLSVFFSRVVSFRNGGGRVVVVVVVRRDDGKGGVCEDSWTKDDDDEE